MALIVVLAVALTAATPVFDSRDQPAPTDCTNAVECRAQTEAAIEQNNFERAHDLAWRAVQRGAGNDSSLMLLLARAQALSGRPDDALVMLKRVAELGVVPDVRAVEFRRTRELPGWPAVEELIARIGNPAAPPKAAPAPTPTPIAPIPAPPKAPAPKAPPAAVPVAPVEPAFLDVAGSFSRRDFTPGGLVCDAASGRYVFGDRRARILRVVAEGAGNSIDLTRGEAAGFLDVMALDIDTVRGDLWVVSAERDGSAATLHKLQLVSGRVLARYDLPAGLTPVDPIDLTVTASGAVLILDAAPSRILVLKPGAAALEVLVDLKDDGPASFVAAGREEAVFVAHRAGIARVDLRTRVVTQLGALKPITLAGVERLRRHGSELVGTQVMPDGIRRLVRLRLDAAGQSVTRLRVVGAPVRAGGPPAPVAVCGDTVAFLIDETSVSEAKWTLLRARLAK